MLPFFVRFLCLWWILRQGAITFTSCGGSKIIFDRSPFSVAVADFRLEPTKLACCADRIVSHVSLVHNFWVFGWCVLCRCAFAAVCSITITVILSLSSWLSWSSTWSYIRYTTINLLCARGILSFERCRAWPTWTKTKSPPPPFILPDPTPRVDTAIIQLHGNPPLPCCCCFIYRPLSFGPDELSTLSRPSTRVRLLVLVLVCVRVCVLCLCMSRCVSACECRGWEDMFDPSVFDIRMVMGVLVCVALMAYAIFRLFVRKWVPSVPVPYHTIPYLQPWVHRSPSSQHAPPGGVGLVLSVKVTQYLVIVFFSCFLWQLLFSIVRATRSTPRAFGGKQKWLWISLFLFCSMPERSECVVVPSIWFWTPFFYSSRVKKKGTASFFFFLEIFFVLLFISNTYLRILSLIFGIFCT